MKLLVLQGVPACGKSTWAKEFVKGKKDWVIVSRDSIRESTGEYWVPEREDYITDLEMFSVRSAISRKLNVILDATNLNPKTIDKWKKFVDDINFSIGNVVELEFKLFEIDYKTALERDKTRERPVGEKVVRRFFKQYFPEKLCEMTDTRPIKEHNELKTDVIVCDIDGTVALRHNRSPYDLSKVSEDTFDPRMKRLLLSLSNSYKILFVSGREGTEQCRKDTFDWLTENFRDHGAEEVWDLIMRPEGDHRNDSIIKEEIYRDKIEPYYNVIAAFDDRDRVVKMWRNQGILCPQVWYGDF